MKNVCYDIIIETSEQCHAVQGNLWISNSLNPK